MHVKESSSRSNDSSGLVIGLSVFCLVLAWFVFLLLWKRKELKHCNREFMRRNEQYMNQATSQRNIVRRGINEQHYVDFRLISQMAINQSCDVAQNPSNALKNRYRDVLPYDSNRVVLQQGKKGDYINASYIDRIFIATQDPLPDQDEDFWQMLWQSNVSVIIRLSSQSTEVPMAQYYPNIENNTWVFGADETHVTTTAIRHLGNIRVIHLKAERNGVERPIVLFHLTSWNPSTTPSASDVLDLVSSAQVTRQRLGDVMVTVHCGAGSGRSGLIIALWKIMENIRQRLPADVFKTVSDLRYQRPGMVQTPEQYAFLHACARKYSDAPHLWPGKDVFKKVAL